MTALYSSYEAIVEQPTTTYWIVDSPLTQEHDFDPTLRITEQDLLPDQQVDPFQRRMKMILVFVLFGLFLFALLVVPRLNSVDIPLSFSAAETMGKEAGTNYLWSNGGNIITANQNSISTLFAPPVQYWSPQIMRWAAQHDLDPDMVATVMQIESCGDPRALSGAGAQGLFQVMPFHFIGGEDAFDPETNANRGMAYLAERLVQTKGDVGLAFAGYNGGHVAAGSSWNKWAQETQRYYVWSTGIYADAKSGLVESPTLKQWMSAGGESLCAQAAQRLGLIKSN